MAEIINIPDFGEVRLSLKEYNEMRDSIRKLEEDNDALVEERDQICDENKVRVRRQTIFVTHMVNPRGIKTLAGNYDQVIFTNSYRDWHNAEGVEIPKNVAVVDVDRDWRFC